MLLLHSKDTPQNGVPRLLILSPSRYINTAEKKNSKGKQSIKAKMAAHEHNKKGEKTLKRDKVRERERRREGGEKH